MPHLGSATHTWPTPHRGPRGHFACPSCRGRALAVPGCADYRCPQDQSPCLPHHRRPSASRAQLPEDGASASSHSAEAAGSQPGPDSTSPESHLRFPPRPHGAPLHGLVVLQPWGPPKRHPSVPTSFQQPPPPTMRRPRPAGNLGQKEGWDRASAEELGSEAGMVPSALLGSG